MKRNRARYLLGLLLFFFTLLSATPIFPQTTPKKITYEQVFLRQAPHILKPMVAASSWLDDEHYLIRERDEKTKSTKLFKVKAKTGEKTILFDFSRTQKNFPEGLEASQYVDSASDFASLIYSFKNDLYQYSPKTEKLRRLTATPDEEKNPRLSPDGKFLAYTRNQNLFVLEAERGLEHQLTADGSQTIYNGWASWVYYEEILGRRSRYAAFWWAPDSQKIAFLRFDDSPVPVFPLFRTSGVHGEQEIERYPKAGDPNPKVKLGIVNVLDGKTIWADVDEQADQYLAWPFWLPDSTKLFFQWMNRDQTNIKLYALDPQVGKKQEIYNEQQTAWVEFFEDLYFFKDGSGFLLRSDVDGWRHLYYCDLEGKLRQRLTSGEWQVTKISLVDEKNKKVYFTAQKDKTTETHLYQVGLDGKELKKLTKEPGSHEVIVSPGGSYFLDNFSNIASPSKQGICRTDGTFLRTIDSSQTPLLADYALGKAELFSIPTEDGWNLPARWVLPPDFDENKKYPVIFFVYGGPGDSSVSNSYPSLYNFYLAQEGIIVLGVDHRGSGHFGKKGAALMHRNLGKWEMHDLIEAVKWLRQKPFIDKDKIGITGGSYGGYTTCLALTYGADYFTHGYAGSSVTDWALYDSVYTERYMDMPSENKEGYEFGSVMTHANKLRGVLFMDHGDLDDNVHLQNTVQLISALIDADKDFEFMLYPNQRHGYSGKKREHSNRQEVRFWFKHLLDRSNE